MYRDPTHLTCVIPWPSYRQVMALKTTRSYNIGRRIKTLLHLGYARFHKQRLCCVFEQLPWAAELFARHHRLFMAPFQHYVDVRSTMGSRFAMVISDLNFFDSRLERGKLAGLTRADRVTLVSDPSSAMQLDLGWNLDNPQEGLWLLTLRDERCGGAIFSAAFSIYGNRLFVGAIQGPPGRNRKSDVRDATRALHGMRPRYFLIEVLRQCASLWQLDGLVGIDGRHQFKAHSRSHRVHQVYFDYTQFWQELGAMPEPDGNWRLPELSLRKPIDAIESRKRAMYLRRFALLDATKQQLSATI
ncbi:DUF535 family protein [uncultured Thiodictyon sp.]|uniref:DUF535 family protein n=1 Tax=uncultured Thiodictyon sp. TaxID=1846217 RepID=UPI0025EDDFC6|nr:DUF535 family protein [uncultured Thiodictyon sp.]